MKIAKLSVTPGTINDVMANLVIKVPPKLQMATRTAIKNNLLAQLTKLTSGIKTSALKRYVLVGYQNMLLMDENDPKSGDCFVVFNTQAALNAQFNIRTNKNIWARYEFPKPISAETQLRYESFFSGFLYYYDTELRNGMSDHAIYCRWQKKANRDVVTVYLDPAPLRHKLNPIPGTNRSSKTPVDYANIMAKRNRAMKATILNPAWTPPTIDGLQSDPPSPQGPPPPPVLP